MYETALRISPEHADGWFVLGNCLAHLGMQETARTSYREALKIDPAHQNALHNLEMLDAA
jgi:cytochrome c-type biogenesis protein CcmH/NrfG